MGICQHSSHFTVDVAPFITHPAHTFSIFNYPFSIKKDMAKVKRIPTIHNNSAPIVTPLCYHDAPNCLFPRCEHPDHRTAAEWRKAVEARLQQYAKKASMLNQFRKAFGDKNAYYSLRN